jgi:hypothetical protein
MVSAGVGICVFALRFVGRILASATTYETLRSVSNRDAESGEHLAPPKVRNSDSSTIKVLRYPFSFDGSLQERCAECAANMRASLTPVQARVRESPSQLSRFIEVNLETLKALRSIRDQKQRASLKAPLIGLLKLRPLVPQA